MTTSMPNVVSVLADNGGWIALSATAQVPMVGDLISDPARRSI